MHSQSLVFVVIIFICHIKLHNVKKINLTKLGRRQWLTPNFSLCLEPLQKAFNEQFYEEDENEKPVFEDDLDDIGECCVGTVCVMHITPVKINEHITVLSQKTQM